YGDGEWPCALGSVKTNLGHLEAAAGIAGFIKAVLAVQRGQIPPNLHFTLWNPAIDASSTRLFVPTAGAPWPTTAHPRRAGVSSFGVSGTNAHVVVEQGPPVVAPVGVDGPSAVSTLVVSGRSAARVGSWASVLADWLAGAGAGVGLADVAHTLSHHRARHGWFATVAARDCAGAVAGLRALAAGQPGVGVVGPHEGECGPGVVFVYSGQGSQWAGMGRVLLAEEPAFAAAVAELEPVFVAAAGFSLRQVLADGLGLAGIECIQPALVGMQLALTALWRSYGVSPDAVVGHSMGEVAAAVVAGALSPADGLRVIVTRSRLMARLSGRGAMALVELDAGAAEALVGDDPRLSVAVYASPRQSVLAGPPEAIEAAIAAVGARNRLARRIEVDVASHHRIIDPILAELRGALADLTPQPPSIPLLSTTCPGGGATPRFDAEHWVANLRNPVRFQQAITAAGAQHHTFIEISPHPLLTHAITDTLAPNGSHLVTSAMSRDDDQTVFFHSQLAAVGAARAANGRLADIPSAPWRHSRFWVADRSAHWEMADSHPLLGKHFDMPSGPEHVWQGDVGTDVCRWLADHKVYGQPIMPAAGFVEIALAAGSEALGVVGKAVSINQLEVEQMLPLDGHTQVTTQLIRGPDNKIRVEIHSRSATGGWCRHAVAKVEELPRDIPFDRHEPITGPTGTAISPADFYAVLRQTGQHHGPAFAALTRIVRLADGSAETEITVPDEAPRHSGYRIHPVVLDAALQSLGAAMPDGEVAEAAEVSYLPVSFDTIRLYGDVGRRATCRAQLTSLDEGGAGKLGTITLMNDTGTVTAQVDGICAESNAARSHYRWRGKSSIPSG
ncbi:MAG: type I polyketide synthase, partial [Mycolicibacterium sp.]|nr:type I polyketide synthase [Mycolicibacterium sp.]